MQWTQEAVIEADKKFEHDVNVLSENFEVGTIVKFTGLVGRSDLNGLTGMIVEPSTEKERQELEEQGRIKVERCSGDYEVVSVKKENLEFSVDSEWRIFGHSSILERLRKHPYYKEITYSHRFCALIWQQHCEMVPPMPLTFDADDALDFIVSLDGHKLLWIGIDALCHHFMIENVGGVFRIYQCGFVSSMKDGETQLDGYSAADWAAPQTPSASLYQNDAFMKRGGGKSLSRSELEKFVLLLKKLQRMADEIVQYELLPQVPGWDLNPKSFSLKNKDKLPSEEKLQKTAEYTHDSVTKTERLAVLKEAKVTKIFQNSLDGKLLLKLDTSKGSRVSIFESQYRQLVGDVPHARVYLHMLNHAFWRFMRHPEGGHCLGWLVRAANLEETAAVEAAGEGEGADEKKTVEGGEEKREEGQERTPVRGN